MFRRLLSSLYCLACIINAGLSFPLSPLRSGSQPLSLALWAPPKGGSGNVRLTEWERHGESGFSCHCGAAGGNKTKWSLCMYSEEGGGGVQKQILLFILSTLNLILLRFLLYYCSCYFWSEKQLLLHLPNNTYGFYILFISLYIWLLRLLREMIQMQNYVFFK